MLKHYFYFKASLNSLFKDIPSTYKINTTLYETITIKRPSESYCESISFKCKLTTNL